MTTSTSNRHGARRDADERRITHFIPSAELKGSRAEQLETLDRLIRHLERLRRTLTGPWADGVRHEGPNPRAAAASRLWTLAGVLVAGVVLLMALVARGCG